MLKDVTLGRYYPIDSPLHRLDPRTKMAAVIVYIVTTFLASTPLSCALTFAVLGILIYMSRVPLRYMLKGLRAVLVIVIVTDLINIFLVDNGLWKAFLITIRMFEIVLGSNLLSLTTKPKDIASGIEKALSPLKAIKVPVHDLATMVSIAFRFLPILTQEADRVMDAQKARGADFESGNLIRRAKALMPILIPLFVSAFRRADELALAMDSRLYGSTPQPGNLHPLSYTKADSLAYILSAFYLAAAILLRRAAL